MPTLTAKTCCSGENTEVFWDRVAPCDHLLQIYDNHAEYLQGLSRFVSDGFKKNESVVVIATAWHINALERCLGEFATDLLRVTNQYIPLDAEQVLAKFMVDGWPDQKRFEQTITKVLIQAGQGGRRVRAFGEMVALLWVQGHADATFQLEYLWHQLQKKNAFSLFCAYPRKGFEENSPDTVQKICQAHSKMVPHRSLNPLLNR
jgi:MEDS: MEthanogen/methylotroph, DcmR Sensory domain